MVTARILIRVRVRVRVRVSGTVGAGLERGLGLTHELSL